MKNIFFTLCLFVFAFSAIAQTENVSGTEDQEEEVTYRIVETMPEFPGGTDSLYKYLGVNINYPEEALKKCIQGVVYVQFVVDKSGAVTETQVLRSVHPLLDEESVRVIQSMPSWKPGIQRGKPVSVYYMIPVKFKMECDKKKKKKKR